MSARSAPRDAIVTALGHIADELEALDTRREELYAARLAEWQHGRALSPPMTQRVLGEASRVTEGAVTQALRKVRQQ